MKINIALQSFYRRCIAINVTNATLLNYKNDFTNFSQFISTKGVNNLEQITSETIVDYIVYLKSKNLSPVTIQDRFRELKTLFNYHVKEGNILISPLQGMKKPKVPKIYARTFTNDEIKAILQYFPHDDFISYRNYVIMCMFFGTGIRRAELLRLTVSDIHMKEGIITIIGKGNKQRIIPISGVLKRILAEYLKRREMYLNTAKNTSPALIINHYGYSFKESGLMFVFRQLKENLGFPKKRLSPHTWRHTFAKNFLLNGGNVFALQRLLGHEDIETTKIYIDYTINEIKTQNENYNPLNNNRWQYY